MRSSLTRLGLLIGLGSWLGLHAIEATRAAEVPPTRKPIRALLITGGPFHDYAKQAKILTDGLTSRANIDWTIINEGKQGTADRLDFFAQPKWANGFDVVVHNECYADVDDAAYVAGVVEAHKAGVPAVVVHCAMHTFRKLRSDEWREFLGVTTVRHGPQHPLVVHNDRPGHPIMQRFPATWMTGNEELYWIDKLWPESEALASAKETTGESYPVCWTHQYGKARVFGTTLAHNDRTMTDPIYLDLVARGLLWAAGKLDDAGKPTADAVPVKTAVFVPPLDSFTIPGVEPRAADADAPLAAGWPAVTQPGTITVKALPAYRSAVARAKDGSMRSDNVLFYPLFLHINQKAVAMTSPVINSFDPGIFADPETTGDVTMEFVYRTPTTGSVGTGLGSVVVEDHPARSYVCLGVQGVMDAERMRQAVVALEAWLAVHRGEWSAIGAPRRLGYHPPLVDARSRLWEVQIPVAAVPAAAMPEHP